VSVVPSPQREGAEFLTGHISPAAGKLHLDSGVLSAASSQAKIVQQGIDIKSLSSGRERFL
jgi:hypothetical protein